MHDLQQGVQICGTTYTRVWVPYRVPFIIQPVSLIRNTWNLVFAQIMMTGGHTVDLVTSHNKFCILQTVLYFIDRSIEQSIFDISMILTLILTIVENFVLLPYLEVTFVETSYLSVFGVFRPIIYRPDELFNIIMRILCLPTELTM